MKIVKIVSCFLCCMVTSVSAQTDGYWDAKRATQKEVNLAAGKKTLIVSEELPVGTTEIAFRITSLDDNQSLSSGLINVLKSIPDPSGISQGSAGAVLLLSKISGDDKHVYHIFSNQEDAQSFIQTSKTNKVCYFQDQPVSKDAKVFALSKNSCLKQDQKKVFIVVESKNWMLKQKVVVEFVPWVDLRSSKGWSAENRNAIIDLCKTSNLAQLMINSNDFCVCILEQFQSNYRFADYDKLLAMEKSKIFRDYGNNCLSNKSENHTILESIRSDANQYYKDKNYEKAIKLLNTAIVDKGSVTVIDYNNIGKMYLLTKQFEKALKVLEIAQSKDDSELMVQMNLAHLYLLQDNYSLAKSIHKKYKDQNINAKTTWKNKALEDFEMFKNAGFSSDLFDKAVKYLNQ